MSLRAALAAAAVLLPGAALAQTIATPMSTAAADEPMAVPAGYAQVWGDEFDRPGLPDSKRWAYDTARNKQGWWNNELQYYAAARTENVRVENGRLIIEARKERLADRADYGGQDYSSGKIFTRGIADWTYGFIEVRAKLACGKGLWPAIWMLGSDEAAGWPALGEIDVMEHVGWDPGRVHSSVHTKAYNHVIRTQRPRRRWCPTRAPRSIPISSTGTPTVS